MSIERFLRVGAFEVVVVAVVGALLVIDATVGYGPHTGPRPLGYLALVIGAGSLLVYRRAPRVVLAVTIVAMLGYGVLIHPSAPAAFPVMVAMHTAARLGYRVTAFVGSGVYLVCAFMVGLRASGLDERLVERTLLLVGWFLAAGLTGLIDRHRRAYLVEARERALEAERTREQTALRRADEERLRIARDLHDSLTHSISIVKLQAGVAVHLARKRGEEVPPALLAIEAAGREAMHELRTTLGVLRGPADGQAGHGLARLGELVDRARAAGVATVSTVTEAVGPLPVAVDRTAYRIVQEALTNAARHAGRGASVVIEIACVEGDLVIRVVDDGVALPGAWEPGIGLTGMRERVVALGGRLAAEPRPEGGFAVHATLPLDGVACSAS
ncbi:sensor histidine kinase [Streptomyces sp. SID3343]|uniref:sensor histidine kinase n=1 Tax=Streptomyces sp. SID3343 TaxID=2690260 RepID=UPI0013708A29|nr:sensor histidine kinase [Streptomyces sp. SID3343]MYW01055.1 sensor histidine kinase [Streptomyces sp. SID3343]